MPSTAFNKSSSWRWISGVWLTTSVPVSVTRIEFAGSFCQLSGAMLFWMSSSSAPVSMTFASRSGRSSSGSGRPPDGSMLMSGAAKSGIGVTRSATEYVA